MAMRVFGVDGCKDGWVVVALEGGAFLSARRCATFAEVLDVGKGAHAIGVDMPIGLVEEGARTCDRLVQAELGPRRASLFTVPPRRALLADRYEDANATSAKLAGFGVSKQLWNLKPKILEVAQALAALEAASPRPRAKRSRRALPGHAPALEERESLRRRARIVPPDGMGPSARARIVEVHPEASFRELAGAPIDDGKKSYDGIMRRLELLESAGILLPRSLALGRVGIDDVLDAAAAAWTADRVARGLARSLPDARTTELDGGHPIAIWI